ncbi:MAG: Hint domain-containing protein [Pseudomonadota bacterium]
MADFLNGVFISELLADNAGNTAIDTDGDGRIRKSDEFIELQNASGSSVSLDGYEIWSETNGLLYAFDASDTLDPGETATVVGNYDGSVPPGFYDAGIAENGNFIPDGEGNKSDTIFLVDRNTGEYVTLSYGDPPVAPTLPPGFPGTTQLGVGESIDSSAPNGVAFARNSDGDLEETAPTPGWPNLPCFVKGTCLDTARGYVPVEAIVPGDLVLTRDKGFLPVCAVGAFRPSGFQIRQNTDLEPVVFPAGTLGNTRALYLSAAHRVMPNGISAELMFGSPEVLVTGRQCLGSRGVAVVPVPPGLVYYHLLLETHEIVRAEGCWVESLFLGDLATRSLDLAGCW